MADTIQCPICGAENPPAQKTCQRCQSPLTSGALFEPGQAPVQKDTGELESLLPQWLRDAHDSAKQTEQPFAPQSQPPQKEEPPAKKPAASELDFLAGLQSQAVDDDEEEVPDWLASITGLTPPKPKTEEPEANGIRWVETGKKDDFQQEETPAWLAGIQAPQFGAEEKDELTDWFRESDAQAETSFQLEKPEPTPAFDSSFSAPASEDTPDWLKQMAADAGEKQPEPSADDSSFGSSDWFSQTPAEPTSDSQSQPSELSDTPDWLKQMQSSEPAQPAESFNFRTETPDWLSQMQADSAAAQPQEPELFNTSSETPDWLESLGSVSGGDAAPFAESTPAESEPLVSSEDVPAWLAPEQDASKKTDSKPRWLQSDDEAAVSTGMPAWLASNEKTLVPDEQAKGGDEALGDLPDWLKSAAPKSSIFDEPQKDAEQPAQTEEPSPQTISPFKSAPAFAESDLTEQDQALFTEMPDWLSNAMESPATPSIPEPITGSDALAPDVLPSWVEAMRPTDQSMSNIVAAANDQTLESRGALAGLSGVLPMGAGFTPTSKPKAHSLKLNASDEQVKHAEILEQILAAETAPQPLVVEKPVLASRGLRWALAFLLVTISFVTTFMRTQIFSVPLGVPNELGYAVAIAQAIPENSPVLVAVDYEPSRAGEMEAAAAPLFDNMLLLKHPRLTFVASNESGSTLAERFITGPLAVHNYQSGVTYLNLGYLSGGQMGIRAFAQNPASTVSMDIYGQPAWVSQPLQGVTALNQFALIILITDDADAARSWVEQTQGAREAVPLLVISSAQAAPMIQPYYDSGQVNGMVSGLYGGAIFERQYNNGRPGAARNYWDAYSIGMLLAMAFVLGGGFVSMALGMRERAAAREVN
ncbi:MAG: hypothetical protein Fur0017_21350 [Anaerolineales bacterium]